MSNPLVSICIPTYKRPELLERAVRSCLAQTYPTFEILITDNSPDDTSGQVLAKLNDPRIKYHKNETNLGPYGNVSRVAALATGEYIKFLMDDDLLKPLCLELMVSAFEHNPTAGLVMAPMDLIDKDDHRIFPRFYVFRKMDYRYRYQVGDGLIHRKKILTDFLVKDYPCCVPSGVMWRRECFTRLGYFDSQADFAVDLDFCMRIAAHWDFYYIDQVLSSWRLLTVCHTATLHQTGMNIGAFYYITRKSLADEPGMKLFDQAERKKLQRDALFFCSCRALLNGLAGLRARNPRLIRDTIRTIFREDPYWLNKLRLPLFVFREIWRSLFPKKLPPPRHTGLQPTEHQSPVRHQPFPAVQPKPEPPPEPTENST
ncbi:MAG: glycosyltransferase [Pontiellaceae bacterium]|jgi:glycosyltransferase involved in cell wall biosynthesis|nr:glycosyltransferase [Pontiellaceae bacterium]